MAEDRNITPKTSNLNYLSTEAVNPGEVLQSTVMECLAILGSDGQSSMRKLGCMPHYDHVR